MEKRPVAEHRAVDDFEPSRTQPDARTVPTVGFFVLYLVIAIAGAWGVTRMDDWALDRG